MGFVESASKGRSDIGEISKLDKTTVKCNIFIFIWNFPRLIIQDNFAKIYIVL